MEKLFESWKTRNLTLFGKCSVVNTLAISKLVYVASILKLPDQKEIKYINKLIFSFLWCNKDRIKRNTMIGTIEQGGIGVVDIESKLKAIKASWIGKLLNCKCKLKSFLNILCDKVGVDFIYITHTNEIKLSHYSIVHNLPLFYQQIFVSFNECKSFQTNVIATENFLSQPLWNNRFIMYKGKTLCFMDWIKSGLRYVKDIVDENGLKPPEWFLFHLVKKRNWLCEYNIMKFCLRRLCMKYELYKTNFVNEICTHKIYFRKSWIVNPKDYKCKLFYSILRDKKFDAPSHQSFLSRMFNIQRKSSWSAIYIQKKSYYDKAGNLPNKGRNFNTQTWGKIVYFLFVWLVGIGFRQNFFHVLPNFGDFGAKMSFFHYITNQNRNNFIKHCSPPCTKEPLISEMCICIKSSLCKWGFGTRGGGTMFSRQKTKGVSASNTQNTL